MKIKTIKNTATFVAVATSDDSDKYLAVGFITYTDFLKYMRLGCIVKKIYNKNKTEFRVELPIEIYKQLKSKI